MRILLVEDDVMIGEALVTALKDEAHAVDWVKDGMAAAKALQSREHQAVLLDLNLPRRDGLDLLRELRSKGDAVPVIIITAREAVADRIRGLDLGADDYVSKPFDVSELLARLRAVIRRKGGQAGAVLTNGRVTLDPVTREVRLGEKFYVLTGREFAVLHALLLRPGAIMGRDELKRRVYGIDEPVESNVIDFVIHGLRRKLGPEVIKNIRGMGWMVDRG
jgi:two-component system, OmpR family, response regulator